MGLDYKNVGCTVFDFNYLKGQRKRAELEAASINLLLDDD